ncbi:Methyltransferase domain-containing protein [Pedococcus dokdonensis]|uniref:Methyltransferase domain-containing protein n=1 Tax=Pedococcus dokdonensis TaxID=443156 RepID=A0A1H0MRG0_9MICO|nr:class I SAM-dependent methyltransferase [Pedococcus dokdonensis]SDO82967.1 Methyltransferase domain-containing protein [Pedococcus dokdonensis]
MPLTLPPAHEHLTFMSPMSQARADGLVDFLTRDLPHDATVLDLGCGWAELLLQAVAAHPSCRGIGVDTNEVSLAHGTDLAAARGLTERVELLAADARTAGPPAADAVICVGASHIWQVESAEPQPIPYEAALTALRERTVRGGRVVYGEGIWSRPPTPQATAPLAGRLDEFGSLAELAEIATRSGFAPVIVSEADQGEWDEFESGYLAGHARWLAEHPADHPDADEVRQRAARQRAAYLGGYRGILGLAYLGLVAV